MIGGFFSKFKKCETACDTEVFLRVMSLLACCLELHTDLFTFYDLFTCDMIFKEEAATYAIAIHSLLLASYFKINPSRSLLSSTQLYPSVLQAA